MKRLRRAKRIRDSDGVLGLLRRMLRRSKQAVWRRLVYSYRDYIHVRIPETGTYAEYNGVKISQKKKYLDNFLPFATGTSDRPNYKAGNAEAIRTYAKAGDSAIVIGGGAGVTAAILCTTIGSSGDLIIFEGSKSSVQAIETNFELNSMTCDSSIRHAIIGIEETVTGTDTGGAAMIAPKDIPPCDILEMDCEGAEKAIIPDLTISPRVIIVETHPMAGADTDTIRAELEEIGYRIVDVYEDYKPGWIIPSGHVLVGRRVCR